MDENRLKLLEQGVLVLPDEIAHSTFELVLEALMLSAGKPIRLFCLGNGGMSRAAFAIVDLIEQHGQVIGVLPGAAVSNHALIFAACAQRFVYSHASIGLHKVSWGSLEHVDSQQARSFAHECDRTERLIADVLEKASHKPSSYWYDLIQDAGSLGMKLIDAKEMITLGLARPIEELTNGDRAGKDRAGVGIGAQNGATRDGA